MPFMSEQTQLEVMNVSQMPINSRKETNLEEDWMWPNAWHPVQDQEQESF
jgi:hypothetical protein